MSLQPVLASAASSGGGAMSLIVNVLPLVLIFVIFWFLLIRPQQKRMKDHRDMIQQVKRGDKVVTGGGLIGKVTKVMDDEVEVDLGGGQKVRSVKSMLSSVTGPNAGKAAND